MRISSSPLLAIISLAAFTQTVLAIGGVDTPPPPSAPHQIRFTHPEETSLDNGLRVIVAQRPDLPLLAAEIVVRAGAEVDPPELAGAASMTGSLLTKGTDSLSAPQIANAIESLGGDISSGAGWDSSMASVVVMSDKAEPALSILADVIQHPTFKQEEIDRAKKQRLDALRVALQQPGSVAGFVAERVVFSPGAYGHSAGGTFESIQAMQRDDIVKIHKQYYAPRNASLILVGDVTLEKGKGYAQKFFGSWRAAGQEVVGERSPVPPDPAPESVVIDMPEAGQSAVLISKQAIRRDSPDYYSGLVANAALGNGFVSRLNREIRIKRGLSYGVRSSLDARRDTGQFTAAAQTKNESAPEVATLMMAELKGLATKPVEGDELKSRQAVLTGGYARALETNEGLAANLASLATYNLSLDRLNAFIPKINAVTAQDITAFVGKYFSSMPSLIIAGKGAALIENLRKSVPNVRVIAQSELDLNRADLVKPKQAANPSGR